MAYNTPGMKDLYARLCRFEPADWERALEAIAPHILHIDRNATRIWFAFWPLDLSLALASSDDPQALSRKLGLMGRWRLSEQIDESHRFLYAHRYWPQVKNAIASDREWPTELPAIVEAVADAAARITRTDREMLLGMAAVGLMTLRQTGVEVFASAPGTVHLSPAAIRLSPHQVLRRRAKRDRQALFGFVRGPARRWRVTFDESEPHATFPVIQGQEIATAAQTDKRDYRSRDPRCTPGEGPIPVECRAASCGTCWVGVLAGAERLSPVVDRDERTRMKVFGYSVADEPTPLIRLACQARAQGSVSIVIPPWNGMFGGKLGAVRTESEATAVGPPGPPVRE
jgi:ferredoxin